MATPECCSRCHTHHYNASDKNCDSRKRKSRPPVSTSAATAAGSQPPPPTRLSTSATTSTPSTPSACTSSYATDAFHSFSISSYTLTRRAAATAAAPLISRLCRLTHATCQATALTLLVLTLSSCIALASHAAAATVNAQHFVGPASLTLPLALYSTQLGTLVLESNAVTPLHSPEPHGHNSSAAQANSTASSLHPPYNGSVAASYSTYTALATPTPSVAAPGGGSGATNSVYDLFGAVFGNFTAPPPSAELEITLPTVQAIFVSIILLCVILGTVVGNVLVCIAVCMVRKLRRPCNYLLVSLALSDLCVAVLVMPIALLYEVLEKWNFGPLLCDVWVSFDVLCCTASILNLCAISVDRYLAITKPLEYGVKRTPRRMMLCVALVWLAAACISLPPLLILGNEHVDEQGEPICAVCQNFAYQIYATLGSFYIPLAVMLFVYYQIFRAAHRIVLEEKRAQTHLQHALNGTGGPQPVIGHTELGSGNGNGQRHSSYGNTSLTYSTCGVLSAHGGGSGSGGGVSGSSNLLSSPHQQKKIRFQLAKEKKASTTLGIIMSAFTICWLPFFILALIRPFVESETTHVPQSLSSLFLWLGYANSLLNPIIYATLNRDFRKPFQAILYFRCSSLNTMMRENYYQDQYGEPPSQRVMLGDERHGARESFL